MLTKLSLLLFVAIVMAGGIYAVQALAYNSSYAASTAKLAPAVQTSSQNASTAAQCPGHISGSRNCGHSGKCTSTCPQFKDENIDGQCDVRTACHSADGQKNCPDHATSAACPKFTDNDKDGCCPPL